MGLEWKGWQKADKKKRKKHPRFWGQCPCAIDWNAGGWTGNSSSTRPVLNVGRTKTELCGGLCTVYSVHLLYLSLGQAGLQQTATALTKRDDADGVWFGKLLMMMMMQRTEILVNGLVEYILFIFRMDERDILGLRSRLMIEIRDPIHELTTICPIFRIYYGVHRTKRLW